MANKVPVHIRFLVRSIAADVVLAEYASGNTDRMVADEIGVKELSLEDAGHLRRAVYEVCNDLKHFN